MTDTSDDPSGNNPLYDLLPSVFQQADAAEQFPLLALTQVLQQVEQGLRVGVEALEDVWFVGVGTSDVVLQQIAALVGVQLPSPLRPEHRALVADAIAVRRRKGTAAALPLLLRGASNWYVLVLQAYGSVPPSAWPLAAGAVVPAGPGTRVGLWVWRLPVHALDAIPMLPLPSSQEIPGPWHKWYLRYRVNPLDLPEPIWNVASTALPAASPPVTALPVAVTAKMLAADLDRYRADWPAAVVGAPANSLFYGPDRGLLFQWQPSNDKNQPWQDLPPGNVQAGTLAQKAFPPPDYAVFLSGPIDPSAVKSEGTVTVLMDGTRALLTVTIPPQPTMQQLADALQAAFMAATPTAIGDVSAADLQATRVVPVVPPPELNLDQHLAVIPGNGIIASIQFVSRPAHDDLQLYNKNAGSALALRTVPITDELAARLCDPNQPSQGLIFTDASGQNHLVTLPLASTKTSGWSIGDVVTGLQDNLAADAVVREFAGCVVIIVFPGYDGGPYNTMINTPETGRLCWDLGLERAAILDPETGSLVWPAGWARPHGITASYGRAAVAAIGSGHDRAPVATDPDAVYYPVDATSFDRTLSRWFDADPAIPSAVFTLTDSTTFAPVMDPTIPPAPPVIFFASTKVSQTLMLQASARRVPLIAPIPADGTVPVTPLIVGGLPANTGTLQLDGLLIEGGLAIATVPRGSSLNLVLTDTTLYAEGMAPALAEQYVDPKPPPTHRPRNTLDFSAERCILGAIDGSNMQGTLSLVDCIVSRLPDPGLPQLEDVFATDAAVPGNAFKVQMQRSTILGPMTLYGTSSLDATDVLFAGGLTAAGSITLDHCYVADLQWRPSNLAGRLDGDPPEAATVVRCSRCLGVQAVRLWRCHVRALTLDPTRLRCCTCGSRTTEVVSCGDSSSDERGDHPLKAASWVWHTAGPPIFYPDNCYPNANFARLTDDNSARLLSSASDGGEIGAFNCARMADRTRQFNAALSSALPPGVEADITFLS
jgi:hypothetical protein